MRRSHKAALAAALLLLQLARSIQAIPDDAQPRDQVLGDLRRSHLALEKAIGDSQNEHTHQYDESPAPIMEQRPPYSQENFSRSSPWSQVEADVESAIPVLNAYDVVSFRACMLLGPSPVHDCK